MIAADNPSAPFNPEKRQFLRLSGLPVAGYTPSDTPKFRRSFPVTRRTSRPAPLPDDVALEEGWIRHDGTARPIAADSKPAVLFRSSTRMQLGERTAASWDAFAEGNCWEWRGRRPSPFDILAYWEG